MSSFSQFLKEGYHIDHHILKVLEEAYSECQLYFEAITETAQMNQLKVLRAFQANNVSDFHFHGSTGYGYGDSGRDTLEDVFASLFRAEKALVRVQIVSGTHAIAIGLLGNLQRGDKIIAVTGRPYDTLLKVIGLHGEYGSLIHNGVEYTEIPLTPDNKIDLETLFKHITERTKILLFQRSRGYDWRPSFAIETLESAICTIKARFPQVICFVDNCYGEFVETREPIEIGADLVAGSLIKNPGGGLALTGGYLVGKETLINNSAARLSAPGIGLGVGASLNFNHTAFQGLFMAPHVVGEAVKGAVLAAKFFEFLGFPVNPLAEEKRTDIIQAIQLGSKEKMIAFCRGLQKASPVDSSARPEPALLPGYTNEVIMAGGTFIQGSSIELSADGPIRPPFNIYLQGGLNLAHIKIGLVLAAQEILHS
ncbi:MAG: cystathionine beta-lyase family protein involved in aluminum resistance [Peptococcaceae bacterium]|jgi:cystathionine beta-lyase family protein involved in aluminum resistance|nr:cystathionine beta-lyase family protein involved in aluminum resistance [Peptococcaceae bacterium]